MSDAHEIVDPKQAKQYLLESWALSRTDKLTSVRLIGALNVALELASEGQPVGPLGFVCDLASAMGGFRSESTAEVALPEELPAWTVPVHDASLMRRYEDYVLGKFVADMTLERAADELQKYQGRDHYRALAFAVQQVQQRARLGGALIAPATIKALLNVNTNILHDEFYAAIEPGYSASTYQQLDELIQAVRNCGELLGSEDVFELASGTALTKFGQRIALRQVMQASQHLSMGLPKQRPSTTKRHYEVATNILEEDLYPVGGFSSIANRGTMESLLRSELAYMEVDDRPDLFDIKYARDELLYYSRDENQFFRRRVTVMFVLEDSLTSARVKDVAVGWQRIVMTLATVVAMVNTLTEWLASDALVFEILFLTDIGKTKLDDERGLFELIFREEIKSGRLVLSQVNSKELLVRSQDCVRKSLCYCVRMHAEPPAGIDTWLMGQTREPAAGTWHPLISELCVAQAMPFVSYDEQRSNFEEANDPWREAVKSLLVSIGV